MSVDDYPEHLNPFDENYNGVVEPTHSRQKYNTWSASRPGTLSSVVKQKPTLLEKPWAALNISPKGKIVRRLSILKTAVEKFASKKKRLVHSASYTDSNLPQRSNSLNADYNFRIISPKLKEKIRQQAFSSSISKKKQDETDTNENINSPQPNGHLMLHITPKAEDTTTNDLSSPTSPMEEQEPNLLGARPKPRKKRPPPPPPTQTSRIVNIELASGQERLEDSYSNNSSITQDLEKDVSSGDDNSLTELDHQNNKFDSKNC